METIITFMSGSEIFIILLVVLLLFGANKLPEIARGLGKGYQEFRRATNDIRNEFDEHTSDIKKDLNSLKNDIKEYTEFEESEDPFRDTKKSSENDEESTDSNDSSPEKK